jgi:hypothetical protein
VPSETDCCNDALGQIGAAKITAIDDESINANHCLVFYPPLRDSLLRSHHWNFSITRVQLAQDVAPPVTGFAYAYTLPPDCLKVIEYAGSNPVLSGEPYGLITDQYRPIPYYKIEGGKLLSNDGVAYIVYIRQVTNADEWDALFYQVIATWLASKLAAAIPKDMKKSAELLNVAVNVLLPQALAVDGQEGAQDRFIVDDLIWGR